MRKQWLLGSALLASMALLHTGCGGTAAGRAESSWLACDADQFKLQGTLDGQTITSVESSEGGGLTQLTTGVFSSQYGASNADRTKLDLAWSQTVNDGETTNATGALTMPNSGPLAGNSYCLGKGTQIHFSSDGENFQFTLAGMTTGTTCAAAVVGTLQGCWR
jgi:hypothetical protein